MHQNMVSTVAVRVLYHTSWTGIESARLLTKLASPAIYVALVSQSIKEHYEMHTT